MANILEIEFADMDGNSQSLRKAFKIHQVASSKCCKCMWFDQTLCRATSSLSTRRTLSSSFHATTLYKSQVHTMKFADLPAKIWCNISLDGKT